MMLGVESKLQPLLNSLTSSKDSPQERVAAYLSFSSYVKSANQEAFGLFVEEVVQQQDDLCPVLTTDINSGEASVAQAALQTLGFCVHHEDIARSLSERQTALILQSLCDVILQSTDKNTCTRALWCLSKQNLKSSLLGGELSKLLGAIEHGQCNKNFQSMTVEHEALNAIIRLLEQLPDEMKVHANRWGKLIYPLLVHSAGKLRERAMVAMDMGLPMMMSHQEELGKSLTADLKALLVSEMKRLMENKHELDVLKVWRYYVQLLGKYLHHGSLINQLLPLVEKGFKHPSIEVKCMAYQAWETMIDNFALNPDIIGDFKRVRLIMQVFRINNVKFETVAMEKLQVWWHFIRMLGEKSSQCFEQVVVPLLQFCVSSSIISVGATPVKPGMRTPQSAKIGTAPPFASPGTPHMNLGVSGGFTHTFRSVHLKGAEILGLLLGKGLDDENNPKPEYSVELLDFDIITGVSFFLKHTMTLSQAVKECIVSVGEEIEENLLFHIWYSLVAHMTNLLESAPKKDRVDAFCGFYGYFQQIVESQSINTTKILKLFQAVACLPAKALSSSIYSISSGAEVMQNCPALGLIELLCHHRILETCADQERFFLLFEKLVHCGMSNASGALDFAQSVSILLEKVADKLEHKESLWRLWSIIANPVLEHITKTGEVNQGNTLEYDFSCLYSLLGLPAKHLLSRQLPQPSVKTLMKTWGELYRTFARLAAMVTNAEANVCCEDLCHHLLHDLDKDSLKTNPAILDGLLQMSNIIVECVDFSALSNTSDFGFAKTNMLSPVKLSKKKHKHLGNVYSVISLLERLAENLVFANQEQAQELLNKRSPGTSLASSLTTWINTMTVVFSHLSQPSAISATLEKLATPLANILDGMGHKSGKMFVPQVVQKLEKLWQDVATSLQARYSAPYDSDLLEVVSPLLASTLLHPRRQVKNTAILLWNSTFSHGPPLQYPAKLKPVLASVKAKTAIVLPGWDACEVTVIEETPYSQLTQPESQAGVPEGVAFSSPRKVIGSFMNKAVSPNVKASPLRAPDLSPNRSPMKKARKKLSVDINDMNTQDFVVISKTPDKKRVLTEHQKEVLKEKSTLPALYSNSDASMDVSLMNQIYTESQMEASLPTPEVDITPFPFVSSAKKSASNWSRPAKSDEQAKTKKEEVVKNESDEAEEIARKAPRRRSVRFQDMSENNKAMTDVALSDTDVSETASNQSEKLAKSPTKSAKLTTKPLSESPNKKQPEIENVQSNLSDSEKEKTDVISTDFTNFLSADSAFLSQNSEDLSMIESSQIESDSSAKRLPSKSPLKRDLSCQKPARTRTPVKRPVADSRTKSPVRTRSSGLIDNWMAKSTEEIEVKKTAKSQIKSSPLAGEQQVLQKLKRNSLDSSYVEETQDFQPKLTQSSVGPSEEDIIIEETPLKDSPRKSNPDCLDQASRNLFIENKVNSDNVFDNTGVPMETDSVVKSNMMMPFIKLDKLTEKEIKFFSPKKNKQKKLESDSISSSQPKQKSKLLFTESPKDDSPPAVAETEMEQLTEDLIPSSQNSEGFNLSQNLGSLEMLSEPKLEKKDKIADNESVESNTHPFSVGDTVVESVSNKESDDVKPDNERKTPRRGRKRRASQDLESGNSVQVPNDNRETASTAERGSDSGKQIIASELEGNDFNAENIGEIDDSMISCSQTKTEFGSTRKSERVKRKSVLKSLYGLDTEDSKNKDSSESVEKRGLGIDNTESKVEVETVVTELLSSDTPLSTLKKKTDSFTTISKLETPSSRFKKTEAGLSKPTADNTLHKVKTPNRRSSIRLKLVDKADKPADKVDKIEDKPQTKSLSMEKVASTPTRVGKRKTESQVVVVEMTPPEMSPPSESIIRLGESDPTQRQSSLCDKTDQKGVAAAEKVVNVIEESDEEATLKQLRTDESFDDELPLSALREETDENDVALSQLNKDSAGGASEIDQSAMDASFDDYVPLKSLLKSDTVKTPKTRGRPRKKTKKDGDEENKIDKDEEIPVKSKQPAVKIVKASDKISPVRLAKLSDKVSEAASEKTDSTTIPEKCDIKQPGKPDDSLKISENKLINEMDDDVCHCTGDMFDSTATSTPVKSASESSPGSSGDDEVVKLLEESTCVEEKTDETSSVKKTSKSKVNRETARLQIDMVSPRRRTRRNPGKLKPRSRPLLSGKKARSGLVKRARTALSKSTPTKKEPEEKEDAFVADSQDINSAKSTMEMLAGSKKDSATESGSSPAKVTPKEVSVSPNSSKKKLMSSRASLILQRAKLVTGRSLTPGSRSDIRTRYTTLKSGDTAIIRRPGILKSPLQIIGQNQDRGNDLKDRTVGFRPIHLPKICSPSASPSAGILRKRKFQEENAADSPSPPNKQRRVSFADSVDCVEIPGATRRTPSRGRPRSPKPVNRCLDLPKNSSLITSPLVTTTQSRVMTSQTKFITTPSKWSECKTSPSEKTLFAVPKPVSEPKLDSQLSPTPVSDVSTQESQLDSREPLCPELVECDEPIEQILPQLTSSMWVVGLGQLLRSKNIKTIGELCALSEYDMHSMPIRSPKTATVNKALEPYKAKTCQKKPISELLDMHEEPIKGPDFDQLQTSPFKAVMASPTRGELPRAEDELAKLSPIKGDYMDTSMESDLILESSGELLDDVRRLEAEEAKAANQNDLCTADNNAPDSQETAVDSDVTENVNRNNITRDDDVHVEITSEVESDNTNTNASEVKPDSVCDIAKTTNKSETAGLSDKNSERSEDVVVGQRVPGEEELSQRVTDLSKLLDVGPLSNMSSRSLMHIYQDLNSVMNRVVVALQTKCPTSPVRDQSNKT